MKRLVLLLTVPLALILLAAAAGWWYIDARLLPGLIETAAARFEARTGFAVDIGASGYAPFSRVRIKDLTIHRSEGDGRAVSLTAPRVAVDIDIYGALTRGIHADGLIERALVEGAQLVLPPDFVSLDSGGASVSFDLPFVDQPDRTGAESAIPDPDASVSAEDAEGPETPAKLSDRLWKLLARTAAHRLFPAELSLTDLRIRSENIAKNVALDVQHKRNDKVLVFSVKGDSVDVSAELDYREQRAHGDVSLKGIQIGTAWGLLSGADSLVDISGELGFSGSFFSPMPGLLEVDARAEILDLSIVHPAMGSEAIGGIDCVYRFSLTYDAEAPLPPPRILGKTTPSNPSIIAAMQEAHLRNPDSAWGELRLRQGSLTINGIALEVLPVVRGIYPNPRSPARLDLRIHLPTTEASSIFLALPEGLAGPFAGMELEGSIGWDLDLEIPVDMVREMNWRSSVQMEDFSVVRIPERLNVYMLKRAFTYVVDEGNRLRRVAVPQPRAVGMEWMLANSELTEGQITRIREYESRGAPEPKVAGNVDGRPPVDPLYRYVYLEDMSSWIPLAVLTSEDGDFFFHDGINWLTFRHAVERNLRSGEIEVGASTLTMQLIKNLFLHQDRVFARKLHEAFLVYLTERDARVSKERILELYINLVEFGPGIIGIDEAARHYFGKDPKAVSAAEAVWLASILPAPRRYYSMYASGEIPDSWWAHMRGYFDLMHERGRMNDEEYTQALKDRPEFTLE